MRLDLQVNKQQVMLFVESHYRWIAKPSNDTVIPGLSCSKGG